MQIKTTIRYQLISVKMTIIKKKKKLTTVDEDVEERESLRTVDGNVHW